MDDELTEALRVPDAVRRALRGWQQRVQAVLDVARDDDDLPARLPVLDAVASELVSSVRAACEGLDLYTRPLPEDAVVLREALGRALDALRGIELWHRPPSVAALRRARDYLRIAADRLDTR